MANNSVRAFALQLASTHSPDEDLGEVLARAAAYIKFLQNEDEITDAKAKKKQEKDDGLIPVQIEPTLDEVQQAGYMLVNEKGVESLSEIMQILKVNSLKELPKEKYSAAVKLFKEKLVEGDMLV